MSSARISFTKDELEKLSYYFGAAWGYHSKGALKIARALAEIEAKELAALNGNEHEGEAA